MSKPVNVEVVVGRNEHPERAIRRFMKKCKRELDQEIRDKSPLSNPRFKSKRERRIEKQEKHRREMERQARKRKKAAQHRLKNRR